MARLLGKPGEIIDYDWSPLDSAEAPEYVPTSWQGWHVGVRLVEAFHTLTLMPSEGGPMMGQSAWPLYRYEVSEYFAALVGAEETVVADLQLDRNRTRLRAEAAEIKRMEIALGWPAHYLGGHDRLLCVIVNHVAYFRARGFDLEKITRKIRPRTSTKVLRHRNQLGLDIIARGLRDDEIAVF
jgi:hypothetical protein